MDQSPIRSNSVHRLRRCKLLTSVKLKKMPSIPIKDASLYSRDTSSKPARAKTSLCTLKQRHPPSVIPVSID